MTKEAVLVQLTDMANKAVREADKGGEKHMYHAGRACVYLTAIELVRMIDDVEDYR